MNYMTRFQILQALAISTCMARANANAHACAHVSLHISAYTLSLYTHLSYPSILT